MSKFAWTVDLPWGTRQATWEDGALEGDDEVVLALRALDGHLAHLPVVTAALDLRNAASVGAVAAPLLEEMLGVQVRQAGDEAPAFEVPEGAVP